MSFDDIAPLAGVLMPLGWFTTLALLWTHRVRAAAWGSAVVAMPVLLLTVPVLLNWAADPDEYVRTRGAGALHELPAAAFLVACGLLAIVAAVLSFRRRDRRWGFVAWALDSPGVAVLVYLAFFFRIF